MFIREEETRFGSSAVLGSFVASMGSVAEDARTRGFPSPPLGGFGFIGLDRDYAYYADYAIRVRAPNGCFRP